MTLAERTELRRPHLPQGATSMRAAQAVGPDVGNVRIGSIDAVLEVWPSGHAADYETYVTGKQSVVDLGLLGPANGASARVR